MKYGVWIRDNDTSEVRFASMDLEWSPNSIFWWTEGNFGCSCNRSAVFARAGNQEPPEPGDCNRTRYTVTDAVMDDGTTVQIDGRAPDPIPLSEYLGPLQMYCVTCKGKRMTFPGPPEVSIDPLEKTKVNITFQRQCLACKGSDLRLQLEGITVQFELPV